MKKLITWLVGHYNKKAKEEDRVEILKPIVFSASTTSMINTTLYETDDEKEFMKNIIGEKKYNLRQELINKINTSGFIEEEINISEQKIFIKLQIKAFDYGKR